MEMDLEILKPLKAEIAKFRRFLCDDFPPLLVHHGYDIYNLADDWKWGVKDGRWQDSGVYVIYDDNNKLIYIGVTTATFNKRVKQHTGMLGISTLYLIPFPDGFVSMAPALEAFLIAKFPDAGNKNGKNVYCNPKFERDVR